MVDDEVVVQHEHEVLHQFVIEVGDENDLLQIFLELQHLMLDEVVDNEGTETEHEVADDEMVLDEMPLLVEADDEVDEELDEMGLLLLDTQLTEADELKMQADDVNMSAEIIQFIVLQVTDTLYHLLHLDTLLVILLYEVEVDDFDDEEVEEKYAFEC